MKYPVIMPALGETMDEGTVVQWLKYPGDHFDRGDVLLEVMTDKATFEIEAQFSGYMRTIVIESNQSISVGGVLAWAADTLQEPLQEPLNEEIDDANPKPEQISVETTRNNPSTIANGEPVERRGKIRLSPRARKLAQHYQIADDILLARFAENVVIEARDIESLFAEQEGRTASQKTTIPLTGMRAIIAQRMAHAVTIPQVTLHSYCFVDELLTLHQRYASLPEYVGISLTDWIIKTTATVLAQRPDVNARLQNNVVERWETVNVGIAIDIPEGLVVPVISHANTRTLADIARERKKLKELARLQRLRPSDFENGTFTISNLGTRDIDAFNPLLNPPEVAILGVGRISPVLVAEGLQVTTKKRLVLSLTFDHRAMDGAPAADFLKEVCQLLQTPTSNNSV